MVLYIFAIFHLHIFFYLLSGDIRCGGLCVICKLLVDLYAVNIRLYCYPCATFPLVSIVFCFSEYSFLFGVFGVFALK